MGRASLLGSVGNSPRSYGGDGGEQLALRAFVAQQRGLDLFGEGERLEDVGHRHVQQRVGDGEQADREEHLALLVGGLAGEDLAHVGAAEAEGDELVGDVGDRGQIP